MERRHLFERIEIVAMAGAVRRSPRGIEQGRGPIEAGVTSHQTKKDLCGPAILSCFRQRGQLGDELVPLGRLPLIECRREIPQLLDLPGATSLQEVKRDLVEPAPRSLHCFQQIGSGHLVGTECEQQVGEGGPHPRSLEHGCVDGGRVWHTDLGQRGLRREQAVVHPAQHRHPTWFDVIFEPPGDDRCRLDAERVRSDFAHEQSVGGILPTLGRPYLLGDAAPIARQQVGCGLDHRCRAAVVDLERVVARSGEEMVEIDEELRVGPGIPVDHLVVVTHPEDGEPGRRHQPE